MRGIEGQGAAAFGAGAPASQRLTPGKLAHLARELASMMGRDRQLASERITADHVDRRKHLVKAGLDDAHGQFSGMTVCPILAFTAGFGTTLRREERAKGRAHSRRDDPWAAGRATSDIFAPFRQWESR